MPKHVLIVAGDASGDTHGGELASALRQEVSGLRISALGGENLRHESNAFLFNLVDIGGFGFWEPIRHLPALWRAKRMIEGLLIQDKPDAVILIDYYGFNIRAARLAHAAGIPVFYYVSPQVWASRPGRIAQLARVVTQMLVIFPFEEALYAKAGVPVTFVGHPLLDRLPEPSAPAGNSGGEELPVAPKTGRRPGHSWNTDAAILFTECPRLPGDPHGAQARILVEVP